jgi:uncharacterized FAD-dependent dehydrogenase
VVIGFGPCGIFAALVLAQMGFRPIVLERGKAVRERTQDTWGLWRKNTLNPESNVQFGEGGAGTFSDGKLYSQIKDPKHYGRKVLTEFVKAGAPEEILYVSKPHIGTFRLVGMVENMRAEIRELGGEIRFEQRVTELIIEDGQVRGVKTATGDEIDADHVVLALGHSARDTFEMLHDKGVFMEAKPFSVGFRIEHPQSLIDKARLGPHAGHPLLGAADYKLVHHAANGRAVYSFCMCPGGTVVAATSEPNRVVTNGMSQYSRNERNANAGIVVGITPEDYPGSGPLAGIALQRELESRAFELGGGTYEAPGQLVGDFLQGKPSTKLGSVEPSYKPGVRLGDLSTALPDYAIAAIREAIPAFDRQIRGFNLYDAVLTGVETRTSSPLHHPRGRPPEPEREGPLPGRRRGRLRGRHSVGRRRRHQGGRSRGPRPAQAGLTHALSAKGARKLFSRPSTRRPNSSSMASPTDSGSRQHHGVAETLQVAALQHHHALVQIGPPDHLDIHLIGHREPGLLELPLPVAELPAFEAQTQVEENMPQALDARSGTLQGALARPFSV